jgi:hypothetical protein
MQAAAAALTDAKGGAGLEGGQLQLPPVQLEAAAEGRKVRYKDQTRIQTVREGLQGETRGCQLALRGCAADAA